MKCVFAIFILFLVACNCDKNSKIIVRETSIDEPRRFGGGVASNTELMLSDDYKQMERKGVYIYPDKFSMLVWSNIRINIGVDGIQYFNYNYDSPKIESYSEKSFQDIIEIIRSENIKNNSILIVYILSHCDIDGFINKYANQIFEMGIEKINIGIASSRPHIFYYTITRE